MWVLLILIYILIPTAASADDFNIYMERCAPYRAEIEEILVAEGVEKEFFFLALAESGCVLDARSRAGAVGLWQLMPATARAYGLHVDGAVDERLDWVASTHAAARYLKRLSERYGDFGWVVAAYNVGGSNLARKTGFTRGCGMRVQAIKGTYPAALNLYYTVNRYIKRNQMIITQPSCAACADVPPYRTEDCLTCN